MGECAIKKAMKTVILWSSCGYCEVLRDAESAGG